MGCAGSNASSVEEDSQSKSALSISKKNPSIFKASSYNNKGSSRFASFRASQPSTPVDQNILRETSMARKQSAISIAQAMMLSTKGQRFHDK